jgi:hypothetical protein
MQVPSPPLVPLGGNLIWDPAQNITWYVPRYNPVAYVINWSQAVAWAAGLTIDNTTAGSWSLPSMPAVVSGITESTGLIIYTDQGQMGYLCYDEGIWDLNTASKGPFTNLEGEYWSSGEYEPGLYAWAFSFDDRIGTSTPESIPLFALAVHPGELAPVPIPGAILLFVSGLLGFAVVRRKLKK